MGVTRNDIVKQAQSWIGCNEADGSHKKIIDIYNTQSPLPRGYKVQYTDAWCATFVSACAVKVGATSIIPTECGCGEMIKKFQSIGCWKEDDSYAPSAGDIIFYDWQDTTGSSSDNVGGADHVGIVEKRSGTTITVIEGNYSNSVKRRTIQVNGTYIRGYGIPKYSDAASTTQASTSTKKAQTKTAQPDTIWNFLKNWLGNSYGAAGLMGNIYAESGFIANNAQNSGNTKLGLTDEQYTDKVDNGSYTNFIKDSIGYGICQWTYWSRKQNLKTYADSCNASIGNLDMQLNFLKKEMTENYASLVNTLKNATSVLSASNAVLLQFERPASMNEASTQNKRAGYGQTYYNKYVGTTQTSTGTTASTGLKYNVGDIVYFKGTTHYTSAAAASGKTCKSGVAKVTQVYKGGTHHYHLIGVSGLGSTVYGWTDEKDISMDIKKTTADLYLRKGDKKGTDAICVMPNNSEVLILEQSSTGWYKVYSFAKNKIGWCSNSYIK